MIIDATRKPALVLPDEVRDSLVVRSAGKTETSGHVGFWDPLAAEGRRKELLEIPPEVSLRQGSLITHETRIPLPGKVMLHGRNPYAEPFHLADMRSGKQPPKTVTMPDPMEVISCYSDPKTNFSGTWRLSFRVSLHPGKKFWLVELFDGTTTAGIATIVVKGLEPNPKVPDPLPLRKHLKVKAMGPTVPANAWGKILDDEDELGD